MGLRKFSEAQLCVVLEGAYGIKEAGYMLPHILFATVKLLDLGTLYSEEIALQPLCRDKAALGRGMLTLWTLFTFSLEHDLYLASVRNVAGSFDRLAGHLVADKSSVLVGVMLCAASSRIGSITSEVGVEIGAW